MTALGIVVAGSTGWVGRALVAALAAGRVSTFTGLKRGLDAVMA